VLTLAALAPVRGRDSGTSVCNWTTPGSFDMRCR